MGYYAPGHSSTSFLSSSSFICYVVDWVNVNLALSINTPCLNPVWPHLLHMHIGYKRTHTTPISKYKALILIAYYDTARRRCSYLTKLYRVYRRKYINTIYTIHIDTFCYLYLIIFFCCTSAYYTFNSYLTLKPHNKIALHLKILNVQRISFFFSLSVYWMHSKADWNWIKLRDQQVGNHRDSIGVYCLGILSTSRSIIETK